MTIATDIAIRWVEQGRAPDSLVRAGIRRLLAQRLREIDADRPEAAAARTEAFVAAMRNAPVALLPELANEQHYEVPAEFFALALGKRRKYSACWWPEGVATLDAAEDAALAETCARAELADGQTVLELGCGWGSLSLWMAERYPASRIVAVSNSASQRAYIEAQAMLRGLRNLRVVTADMNRFDPHERFDRIVSVEMFEHMRNWPELFRRLAGWLNPGGRFFMHVFVQRATPYAFVAEGPGDWMSRHFFSGGMMPSDELPARFQDDLRLLRRWRWDGRHYERTCNAWLANLDARRDAALPILARTYGDDTAGVWLARWRIFFMSCAELFGHDGGNQWWVSHYLFERRA
ncbi:SAM-dependent methyltransferase [Derxia lacustris]|uniref:SAM-dependent methyltransferase n=1 Tax=Derxia lacustris TaxID=764842 RepID=UPI000A171A8B|nr:cyclopropane-fatty-acyl-phospholipid synthase family protein [Derxia lacustris]